MGCLDEQTVVAFVSGALVGAKLAEAERHLLGCPDCATLVALAAPTAAGRRITTLEWAGAPRRPRPRRRAVDPPAASRPPLAAPAWGAEPTTAIIDFSSVDGHRPGAMVGRYRLLQLVGRGGMGEVYAAHDPELDRKIAIKVMRGDTYPDDVEAARMMREAQSIAKLSHPNLVTVYDVGTANGRVFVAMELIEGETVAVWLDKKRRPRDEILRVFCLAGRGLAAAHRAGIIHRDFKPQNVMVTADGAVRVMDFGLAALRQTLHGPKARRITRIGSILGTPLYMSPEQLCGQTVDPRADQFSFCVALYEALYGERPFAGDNFAELRTAVLEGNPRPAPLSSRVPARVRAILLRGPVRRCREALPRHGNAASGARADHDPAPGAGAHAGHRGRRGRAHVRARVRRRLAAARHAGAEVREPPRKDVHRLADGGRRPAPRRNSCRVSGGQRARRARALRARRASRSTATPTPGRACTGRTARRPTPAPPTAAEMLALRTGCLDQRARELGALADEFSHADAKVVRKAVAATLALPPLDSCADVRALKTAAPPRDEALRARVQSLRGRLATAWAMAAAGRDWQALKPMGALVDEARATGHEPLLAEALLVYARARAPFDPEGAEPLYEEAFKRGEAIHNDALAAEAAIQLVAIAGAIEHHFDVGERWARIADVTVERGVPLRVRGWFLHNRGTLFAAQGRWRLAEGDFTAAVAIRQQALGAAHPIWRRR